MKKFITKAILVYMLASFLFSVAYNFSSHSWNIANHRNGLLCVGFDQDGVWVLSPFTNYADVFLFGVGCDEDGLYTFSDGLDSFGEYAV